MVHTLGWSNIMFDIDTYRKLCARLCDRAVESHEGRNRLTFILPHGYVIKLPKNLAGVGDNIHEGKKKNTGRELQQPLKSEQYPRTRLTYVDGLPVLFMEEVSHAHPNEIHRRLGTIPAWCYHTDSFQVGFTKQGRLVSYDYGIN